MNKVELFFRKALNELSNDKYFCKDCGAVVFIDQKTNKKIRTCEHNGTIILDLHATLKGRGVMTYTR